MAETSVLKALLLHTSKLGARLFRNNVGAWQMPNGRWLQYGLCQGSSDLIGWTPVTITPEMVGARMAVFTAIEVKAPDAHTDKAHALRQAQFLAAVREAGGIAAIARSTDEADAAITAWRGQW